MPTLDELQIEISTKAKNVDDSIDMLVKKLDKLSVSLKGINSIPTKNLGKISSNFNNLSKSSVSMANGLNRVSASATKSTKKFNGLASSIGKFYATWVMAIRGVKGLWKSIESTADYIEAYNYFNVALGKIGSDWSHQFEKYGYANAQAYADSFSERLQQKLGRLSGVAISTDASGNGLLTSTGVKNLGLNIQEITQYASQLASVTNSVGQVGEVSLATANAFTKLGADISSLFNLDYSQVMGNLQSGLIGQSRALYKYGIDITNATLQTKAYELGLSKSVSEMSQMEKMQLRLLVILQDSRVAWGDLANTINSPSNMIRQLSNNMKELGMVLGQLFIPLLKNAIPVLNGLTIALKELITNIAGFLGVKIDLSEFGQGFSQLEEESEGIAEGFDDATQSAKKLRNQLQGFDKLNLLKTSNNSGAGVGGAIDLTEQILKATEEYEKVWNAAYEKMENRAQEFANKIGKIIAPVGDVFKKLFTGDFAGAGADVSNLVVAFNTWLANAIDRVDWQKLGQSIGDFVANLNWTEILSSFGKVFWEAMNGAIEMWKGSFESAPIETAIVTAIAALKFTGLGKILMASLAKGLFAGFSIKGLATLISGGLIQGGGLFANIGNAIALTLGGAGTLGESFGAIFGSALKTLGTVLTKLSGIGSVIGGVITAFSNFFSMLKNGFNWLNEALMVIGIALGAVGAVVLGVPAGIAAIVAGVVAAIGTIVVLIKDNWSAIVSTLENVAVWFDKNVTQPLIKMWIDFGNTIAKVFEGTWIIIQAVWKIVSEWFNKNVVQPLVKTFSPIVKSIASFFSDLWTDIQTIWNTVADWFNKNIVIPVSGAFEVACNSIYGFFSNLASGIQKLFIGAMNSVINGIESAINFIIGGINKIIGGFNNVVGWAADVIGADWGGVKLIKEVKIPRVKTYATGGFPEDGWFRASKGEYFGKFDDGTSVIANNNQIISGIANGVKSANAEQNALLREQNALLRQILEKEVGISTRDIFNAVRTESSSYTRRTGQPAFI